MRLVYIAIGGALLGCYQPNRESSDELHQLGIDYYQRATTKLVDPRDTDRDALGDSCLYYMGEAIRLDSSNRPAYRNKLMFEWELKRVDEAKSTALIYYRKFNDPLILLPLAAMHYQLGDSAQSKHYLRQSLDHYNKLIKSGEVVEDSILWNLSMVHFYNSNIEESRKYYERYRVTRQGQITFKEVDFDSVKAIFAEKSWD